MRFEICAAAFRASHATLRHAWPRVYEYVYVSLQVLRDYRFLGAGWGAKAFTMRGLLTNRSSQGWLCKCRLEYWSIPAPESHHGRLRRPM